MKRREALATTLVGGGALLLGRKLSAAEEQKALVTEPLPAVRFWRDDYANTTACIDYRFIASGMGGSISLTPGQQEAVSSAPLPSANETHFNVFALNNGPWSVAPQWQSPTGPSSKHIASVLVEVFSRRGYVVASIFFDDGSLNQFWKRLERIQRPCPAQ